MFNAMDIRGGAYFLAHAFSKARQNPPGASDGLADSVIHQSFLAIC
ncbi:Uncharacterised protein [Mycobacterium tuberculosis]|nr:Uncharacterised protein [Mycobacterium tuberculosis]